MAIRRVTQIRFFGDTNTYLNQSEFNTLYSQLDDNEPNGLTAMELYSGSIFANYVPMVQLGIQALPGTKFNLNNNLDPIIIGASGMYELDLADSSALITRLTFEQESLDAINQNPDGYLIIDIITQEG